MWPGSPKGRRPPPEKIDISPIFNVLGVSGWMQLKAEFDACSREVTVASRTVAFLPHEPPLQPHSHAPAHFARTRTAIPPFSTPPVCSWQAAFARSTSSLATILESIVGFVTRCAR